MTTHAQPGNQVSNFEPKPTAPIIYCLIKIGRKEHLDELRATGGLRMQRLETYRGIEDASRQDANEALAAAYQPSQVTIVLGGITIPPGDLVGSIKVDLHDDLAHHVFCMHALTSDRFALMLDHGAPAIDPANLDLGDHALVITNVAAFIERV